MLFRVGIDHFCLPGAEIERLLRSGWDISDFEVVGLRQVGYIFYGVPAMINLRAEQIARHLYQNHEAAQFYIGVARGYDVRYVRQTLHRAQTLCICYDFAVVLSHTGKKVATLCLNKEQVHQRIRKNAPVLLDNEETLAELNETIERLCRNHISIT